jgi:hypothetical protein
MKDEFVRMLAEQSIRDDEQRYTEDQIRALVGAPSVQESKTCVCGRSLDEFNSECYAHMAKGY